MDIEDHHILHGSIAVIYEKEKNDVLSSLTKDYTSLIIWRIRYKSLNKMKRRILQI